MADTQKGTQPDLAAVFSGLTIEPSAEPLPEPARGGAPSGPNPFSDPLRASVERNTPYTFYVPAEAVQRAVFLINNAARKENVGARIVVNVQRDKDGKVIKKDSKSVPIVEKDGDHKGLVMIRFQGLKERKQQTTPRPYSIVPVKGEDGQYIVRDRASKQALFKGTKEQCKQRYDELKAAYLNTPQQPTQPAQPAQTPAATEEQSSAPATSPADAQPAA